MVPLFMWGVKKESGYSMFAWVFKKLNSAPLSNVADCFICTKEPIAMFRLWNRFFTTLSIPLIPLVM